MKKLIIFDLDGTLLNTIADLAHSTNHALQTLGYPTHEVASYNFMVGNGINKLFERALPEGEKTEENVLRVRKEFLLHYDRHNARPRVALIREFRNCWKHCSIKVINWPWLPINIAATEKLIAHYFPGIRFVAVFGQREGVKVKPDPAVVHDILQIADVSKDEVLYVGDSGVDMQTAINSGVTSCGVTWGFRPRTELESFCPDYIVDKAETILSIV